MGKGVCCVGGQLAHGLAAAVGLGKETFICRGLKAAGCRYVEKAGDDM